MSKGFMRPVRESDLKAVHALAAKSGGGMTNLPMDEKALKAKVDFAAASFAKGATKPGGEIYMLVLEEAGAVIGTSAVFSAVGLEQGFVNYKIIQEFYAHKALARADVRRVLVPTHDFSGRAEVGSLFIAHAARGSGYGKLLARARYMFIAQRPEIIADHACAELRGWRAPDGAQPFWNAVGRHFFGMEFVEADNYNAAHGNQFIEDMLPRYPIYMDLLPEDARECLGRPHDNARPAYKMLMEEGFVFNNYIDVFDGGPLVDAKVANIRTVRDSRVVKVAAVADKEDGEDALLATGAVESFRACKAKAKMSGDAMIIDRATAAALKVETGSSVRWIKW